MTDVDQLKSTRTTLRRKVTSAAEQVRKALNIGSNASEPFAILNKVYEDFCSCHEDYSDLVLSDDSYESYRTVSSLTLEQYYDTVQETYDNAYGSFHKYLTEKEAAKSIREAKVTLGNAKTAEEKLTAAIINPQSNVQPVIDFSQNVLSKCKDVYILSSDSVDVDEVGRVISVLEKLILELQCAISGLHNSQVSGILNQTQNSRSSASAPSNALPVDQPNTPFGPAASAVGGGTGGLAQGCGATSDLADFSIVSVFNNKTHHNSHQPLSSTFMNTHGHSSSDTASMSHQAAQHNCRPQKFRFKETPIPTFDGNRLKWVEFRTIWIRYGSSEFDNDIDRAYALKQSLRSEALETVQAITVDQPNAYNHMWHKLNLVYSDVSQGVQYATNQLEKLKAFKESDYSALVCFVNAVEVVYSQLGQLDQLSCITLPVVDNIADLLPSIIKRDWLRTHRNLAPDDQIHPFPEFMRFLEEERKTAYRESGRKALSSSTENQKSGKDIRHGGKTFHGEVVDRSEVGKGEEIMAANTNYCVVHEEADHKTEDCSEFIKMKRSERLAALRSKRLCFLCFGNHLRRTCSSKKKCSVCGWNNHNVLMCNSQENKPTESHHTISVQSNVTCSKQSSLFAIHDVPSASSKELATVFYDGGSNTSYVLNGSLKRLRAVRIKEANLKVTTLGGNEETYSTYKYKIPLRTAEGLVSSIEAYGLDSITGPVSPLDLSIIQQLFPYFNVQTLQRKRTEVDILLGVDQFGMHPKRELMKCGENLSVLEGEFGVCLQGSHALLKEGTQKSSHIKAIVNVSDSQVVIKGNEAEEGGVECFTTPATDDNKLNGLTREELEQFSKDPAWVKIRWVLFIILVVGWAAILIAAIIIVVVQPRCPPTPPLEWYQDGVAYRLDVEKFQDVNGDGSENIAGVEQHLDHFEDRSVKSAWIGDILDGSVYDFSSLAKALKKNGIQVVMDLSASHPDTIANTVKYWTEIGAGGFVLSTARVSEGDYANTSTKLQMLLKKHFNSQNYRARVIISGEDVNATSELIKDIGAGVYRPMQNCTPYTACMHDILKDFGMANRKSTLKELEETETPSLWKIFKGEWNTGKAACNRALKLTILGNPNVMYEDEIGLVRGYMSWDDSANGGFSAANWTYSTTQAKPGIGSVLAQRSTGFAQQSTYSLFKELAALRADEPSLKWGEFQMLDFGQGVISFVRNATQFPPVVVAVNPGEGRASSLVFGDFSQGEVSSPVQ